MNMQAIIVAGGRGDRLRPITDKIPKPMIKVAGKTILEHTINLLRNNGVTDLVVALCYLPEVIVKYFGNGEKFGVKIRYTFEDSKNPMGTAGAIRESQKLIRNDFIVTYADILRQLDVREMIKLHKKSGAVATINIYQEYEKVPRSMLVVSKDNRLIEFIEHPDIRNTNSSFVWTNGSFYIFQKKIFKYIGNEGKVDFAKDVFPKLLKKNVIINSFKSDSYFLDIGTIEKLELARRTFQG